MFLKGKGIKPEKIYWPHDIPYANLVKNIVGKYVAVLGRNLEDDLLGEALLAVVSIKFKPDSDDAHKTAQVALAIHSALNRFTRHNSVIRSKDRATKITFEKLGDVPVNLNSSDLLEDLISFAGTDGILIKLRADGFEHEEIANVIGKSASYVQKALVRIHGEWNDYKRSYQDL